MEEVKIEIKEDEEAAYALVDSRIYSLEAVYDAAYNFLDKAYILLEGDPEDVIKVRLKSKEDSNEETLEKLANEFFNELINTGLRREISQKNQNIREYMVSAALIGASQELQEKIEEESQDMDDDDNEPTWNDDPLGIAQTWEERNDEEDNIDKNN